VVAYGNRIPDTGWLQAVAERVDLPAAAVAFVAARMGRDPGELLAAWRDKTPAEHERFWNTLAPDQDDDLLRAIATLALGPGSAGAVAASLSEFGEKIVPAVVRLVPSSSLPGVLFVSGSSHVFSSAGEVAATWVMRVPALPIAVAVPTDVWHEYLVTAPESRTKALLKEGEVAVPVIDAATVQQTLTEAGAVEGAIAAIASSGADEAPLEAAVAAARATHELPANEAEDDRARSAAERFLFRFHNCPAISRTISTG
jgi:hypothetical protein